MTKWINSGKVTVNGMVVREIKRGGARRVRGDANSMHGLCIAACEAGRHIPRIGIWLYRSRRVSANQGENPFFDEGEDLDKSDPKITEWVQTYYPHLFVGG